MQKNTQEIAKNSVDWIRYAAKLITESWHMSFMSYSYKSRIIKQEKQAYRQFVVCGINSLVLL